MATRKVRIGERNVQLRTILLRAYPGRWTAPINVNDWIGLEPDSDLTLKQHLADLKAYEKVSVVKRDGEFVELSNGEQWEYWEELEPIRFIPRSGNYSTP